MKSKAYVGITGFKEESEVIGVGEQFAKELFATGVYSRNNYTAMFGFICSNKRLADRTSRGDKSPNLEELVELIKCVPCGFLSMVHYYTTNRDNLAEEVKQVFSTDGMYEKGYCRALQINMSWPNPRQVEAIRKEYFGMEIVLQIPHKALNEPQRASEYKDLVQYCLVDPSGGKGQDITEEQLKLIEMLHTSLPYTRIGVAGGLCGENVAPIMQKSYSLIGESLCVDAEGKLRTSDSLGIDLQKTAEYIGSARQAIQAGRFGE
jgi:phosphoribosylanthranilate isomerase